MLTGWVRQFVMSILCFKIKRRVKISPLPERAGVVSLGWAIPGVPGLWAQHRKEPALHLPFVWSEELSRDWWSTWANLSRKRSGKAVKKGAPRMDCTLRTRAFLFTEIVKIALPFSWFFFFFLLLCVACGILVPWPGIEPVPPVTGTQSLNLWSRREAPPSSWLCREESGAHLTPEVTASNCRWWPLGGKLLPLQGGVLEHCLQVTWPRLCPDGWTVPGVPLWAGQPPLQERSPLHYPAVSGVFLLGMFDSSFLLVMLRVNFLLSSRQVITE